MSLTEPSNRPRRERILALPCGVYFLVILDASIGRLTLPAVHRALGLSAASQTWVANAYMLSFGTLLLGGRVTDLVERKMTPGALSILMGTFRDAAERKRRSVPGAPPSGSAPRRRGSSAGRWSTVRAGSGCSG